MKTHLIIGSKIEIDIEQLKREYKENGHSLVISGDSKNHIDCNSMSLPSNANIIIYAHGFRDDDRQDHLIDLCISKSANSYYTTKTAFKKMFGNKKPIHISLYSCFAGAASENIKALALGSTLMTFISEDKSGIVGLENEIILRAAKFDFLSNNPFARFIQLLFITPSDNKFTLRTKAGIETFTSSLDKLVDYSVYEIKAWQQNELLSFAIFSRLQQKNTTPLIKKQIDEFLKALEDSSNQNWQEHNIIRYQELLFINLACWDKIVEMQKLLSLKININAVSQNNETALSVASSTGNHEVVKLLLELGADPNIAHNDDGATALYTASMNGHYKVAELLVKARANIEAVTHQNVTALYMAAQKGYLKIIKFLVDSGANKETLSAAKAPALFAAVQKGHYEVVKYLVENSANKNFIMENGYNALFMAAERGHDSIVEYLADEGVDKNIKLPSGETQLGEAASRGFIKVVKVLVDKGANIDIIGRQNGTALYLAAQEGFEEIVDILIKAKSKVNFKVNDSYTALMSACYSNHLKVVKLLLAAGTDSQVEPKKMIAIQLTTSEAIIKEIKAFEKDPFAYILKHNEQAQYALNAFNNLKMVFTGAEDAFVKVEECLEAQAQYENLNLNDICGTAGSYYNHDEL